MVACAVAVIGLGGWFAVARDDAAVSLVEPARSDLGIFAGVRGWIVYGDPLGREPGIWAMDPANPDVEPVLVDPDGGLPLAWSSDGSKLLILRAEGDPDTWGRQRHALFVLDADGTGTQVARLPRWMPTAYLGGSFTPTGSQVIYGGRDGIYSVAADGGSPRLLFAADGGFAPVLSPDGTRLAFFEGHGDTENSLWVMNIDGTDKREILGIEESGRTPFSLQWSPDGTRLAFSRGGVDRSFGVVNADGSGLAFAPVEVSEMGPGAGPYWSPDGTHLAFATGPWRSPSLVIARPDGTELQEFGVGPAGPWNPLDPAPTAPQTDGGASTTELGIFADVRGWIAYGEKRAIWALDPAQPGDRGAPIQLSSERGEPTAWSADGSELLVWREVPRGKDIGNRELYILNVDGTWNRVTHTNGYGITGGSFSPDGTEVVYAVWRPSGNAIYVVDVESGTQRLVTDDVAIPYEPAFSPDGSQIAFFDGSGDWGNTLRVMNADGSHVRGLTGADYGHIDELAWSPDGTRLAFSLQSGGGLFIVGVDGSGLTELVPDGENPAWSPDGSRISFQRRAGTPVQEVRDGETVDVTYCPCDLGPLEIVTLDGGDIQVFGHGGSGPWNPLEP